jgi:hypothetical protein
MMMWRFRIVHAVVLVSMAAGLLPGLASSVESGKEVVIQGFCDKLRGEECPKEIKTFDATGAPVGSIKPPPDVGKGGLPATQVGNGLLEINVDGKAVLIRRRDAYVKMTDKPPIPSSGPCRVEAGTRGSNC